MQAIELMLGDESLVVCYVSTVPQAGDIINLCYDNKAMQYRVLYRCMDITNTSAGTYVQDGHIIVAVETV